MPENVATREEEAELVAATISFSLGNSPIHLPVVAGPPMVFDTDLSSEPLDR